MLHLGDDLAGDVQFGRNPIDAVGVQPDHWFGDDCCGIELVGDRYPVLATKSTFREPATDLPPPGRVMSALTLNAPT